MKKVVIILLTVIVAQMSACKKDDLDTSTQDAADSKVYTIRKYDNNVLQSQFGYTRKKLTQFVNYNTDGSVADSCQFFYTNQRLDYILTNYTLGGFEGRTSYEYDADNKVIKIEREVSSSFTKVFNIRYNNFDELLKIDWELMNTPFEGELSFNSYGNVNKSVNWYIDSSKGTRNKDLDLVSFNQFMSPVQRFWVVDPLLVSPSINNRVELIRNRSINHDWTNSNGGTWNYETYSFAIRNTYNVKDYLIETFMVDSNNVISERIQYEYIGF